MRAALLALLPALAFAQALPDRPEKTTVPPLAFRVPQASEHRVTLKNGIPAFLVSDATAQPLVTVTVTIRGGSYLDPAGKAGLTQLLGQLLRSGGTATLSPDQVDERLDLLAAQFYAVFTEDTGALQMNLMEKDLPEGLALLKDLLLHPAFAQERLDLLKRNTLQRLEQLNDDPRSIERYQAALLTYGEEHPAARIPQAAFVKGLTRQELLEQHARLLHPGNLTLAVGGRFDRKAVAKLLEQHFGTLKAGPEARRSPAPPAPLAPAQPGLYLVHKENPQGRVTFLLPGLRKSDPDWVPVQVMNFILGGDFTSRLTALIRTQEGLSYHVNSAFTPGAWFPGGFRFVFQTRARSVAYGTRLALGEFRRIQAEEVSDAELAKAKGALVNGFPAEFGNPAEVAQRFAEASDRGLPANLDAAFRAQVQAVTKADILRVAKKYLPLDKLAVLVVGPKETLLAGDVKDHPGPLAEVLPLPLKELPLRDPATGKPLAK
jgi:predicted Zn-dependent peptidase